MSNEYVQCLLENVNNPSTTMVSFIPLKLKKAKMVEDENKERWRIKEIYLNSVRSESEAVIRSSDYRRQRRASDI